MLSKNQLAKAKHEKMGHYGNHIMMCESAMLKINLGLKIYLIESVY